MNRVELIGRLTKDPELKSTQSGKSVLSFTVAVDRRISKEAKEKGAQSADFISCVAWDSSAEFLDKYGRKGDRVSVEGKIQTRNYDGADGKKVYVTEVLADNVQLLTDRSWSEDRTGVGPGDVRRAMKPRDMTVNGEDIDAGSAFDIQPDDLPFY